MRIDEWFDPANIDHIKAYHILMNTGMWPAGFIPDGMEFIPGWNILIMNKLADAWVYHMLKTTGGA